MRAAVFDPGLARPEAWLTLEDRPKPQLNPGEVLLKVNACGVCRTDLHIVEGDLKPVQPRIVPGHQIVGEVVEGATPELPLGMRIGVSWLGAVDGDCWFCRHQMENLCDHPLFTGYSVDGGYAEFARVRADFAYPLPSGLDAQQVAPLLCAGIIGFRSLRVAGVERGERVGLYGFGSSASLTIRILQAWGCEVYVVTRGFRGCDLGGRGRCEAPRTAGPRDHICAERKSSDRSAVSPAQRRRSRHQCNSPGPDSGFRLRHFALGRTADAQRGQRLAAGRT